MKYRKDKYGNDISVLGFGCMRFQRSGGSIDIAEAEREIMAAIDGGVNYFDTAYIYPGSEAALGEIFARNNVREKVYIATKLPHYLIKSREGMEKLFAEHLKRLKTDYIDYYLMHMLTDVQTWEKLKKLGIPATVDDFLTSTEATILYLKQKYQGRRFYSFGTKSFTDQLRRAGIDVTTERDGKIDGIVMGNDNELTFKKLEDACILLLEDIPYIATNPDWVCPTAFGYVPDCGSVAEMLYRSTGKRPHFIGKPRPEMLTLAMEKFGYSKEETVMIGDRVYTDIAAGYNAGVDTIFVLSGEGTVADAEASDTKPTYIIDNIREVYNIIKKEI